MIVLFVVCLDVGCCLIAIVSSCVVVAGLALRVVVVWVGFVTGWFGVCLIVIAGFVLGISELVLVTFWCLC